MKYVSSISVWSVRSRSRLAIWPVRVLQSRIVHV
jgi:hypothetical protein